MANQTILQLKRSSVSGKIPDSANIEVGEPVVNLADRKVYTKNGSSEIIQIASGNLQGLADVSNASPLSNQILAWNGVIWAPANVAASGGGAVDSVNGQTGVVVLTTSNIAEGSNLYYSNAKVYANVAPLISNFTYSSSPPGSPQEKDEWLDSATGIRYVYINDGSSSQWVEFGFGSNTTFTVGVDSVGGVSGVVSNAQLLASILTVDGIGSNLDADLLDGQNSDYYSNATNLSSGTLASTRLPTSGVVAATYGNTTLIPIVNIDTYGRIISASNVIITVANTNITGNIISSKLEPTGVTATTYGSAAIQAVLTIDQQGRITSASNVISTVANTNITGNIISSQITSVANTQITGNIISSQITSVANTQITGNIISSQITSVANTQITGNIISSKLEPTGVSAATYGNATIIPVITVDQQGRITSASNVVTSGGVTTGKAIAMAIVFGG